MNTLGARGQNGPFLLHRFQLRRGILFGGLIVVALVAFEIFNYSTTDFALADLLGDLRFLGVRWATILALAFCGIDFAGIARLFTPEEGADEPAEVWYLFGAWMLAATMNAMLTWWGVSIAILNHETLGNAVVERQTLLRVVPIFVAIMVWLIRVLIIGTFSVAGERLFTQVDRSTVHTQLYTSSKPAARSIGSSRPSAALQARSASEGASFRSAQRSPSLSAGAREKSQDRDNPYIREEAFSQEPAHNRETGYVRESSKPRLEPTYHPANMSPRGNNSNSNPTRR